MYWIKELRTVFPYGLNDAMDLIGPRKILRISLQELLIKLQLKEPIEVQEKQIGVKNFQSICFEKTAKNLEFRTVYKNLE